ncbi:MAG: hypothetical protein AB7S69_10000 [Salinivirgaceae bacterium]
MKLIRDIEELLALKGKNLAFFYGANLPAHFGYLEFIRRSKAALPIDHLIVCPNKDADETDLKELRHRLRMMDLVKDTPQEASEIYGFSLEQCHGSKNDLTFDDMLHILKRRGKKIYVLLPCHTNESDTSYFKTKGITFVYACSHNQKQSKAKKNFKTQKLIYMDDIKSCNPEPIRETRINKGAYIPEAMDKYLAEHHLYQNDQSKKTFN